MDQELLMALVLLWSSTTTALVIFMSLWFMNESAALHPHAVDVEPRHNLFLVVKSTTICKQDFAVKSISAFVAPRGASSSKWFTSIIIVMCISGMFGSFRWYKVGDAGILETTLSIIGFSTLMFLAAFESDVSSVRFLEEKLIVTAWLIQAMNGHEVLPFSLKPGNEEFRYFLRKSPLIYELYPEDHENRNTQIVPSLEGEGPYTPLWCSLHIIGAVCYLVCVASAVILHEREEETIANGIISGLSFFIFCAAGYLTGTYFPVIRSLRCIVLVWNPFYYQPNYLHNLKQSIETYIKNMDTLEQSEKIPSKNNTLKNRKNKSVTYSEKAKKLISKLRSVNSIFKSNIFLSFAKTKPKEYLRILGLFFVLTEMIAVLTPSVAIGIQWIAALCPGTAKQAIFELFYLGFNCLVNNDCDTKDNCLLIPK